MEDQHGRTLQGPSMNLSFSSLRSPLLSLPAKIPIVGIGVSYLYKPQSVEIEALALSGPPDCDMRSTPIRVQ